MSNPIVRYVQKQLFGQKGMIANNKAEKPRRVYY